MHIEYEINNFKAFKGTGRLEMAPVTVLCGENSSGKSSILKSLLLVKQSAAERRSSLARDAPAQPLLFNGEWVRLGSWTDTVHGKERDSRITFRWTARGLHDEISTPTQKNDARWKRRFRNRSFSYDLQAILRSELSAKEELSAVLSQSILTAEGVILEFNESQDHPARSGVYRLNLDNLSSFLVRPESGLRSFSLYETGDLYRALTKSKGQYTLGNIQSTLLGPFITGLRPVFDASWNDFFDRIIEEVRGFRSGMRGPRPQWLINLEQAAREYRKFTTAKDEDTKKQAPDLSRLHVLLGVTSQLVSEISSLMDNARNAFAPMWKRIRYLGPLRDQPRRFYQFDDTGGVDIGVSGEFTVQVLALEQDIAVSSTRIDYSSSGALIIREPTAHETLLSETNYWLEQMGLPSVEPTSLQQSLYGLDVGNLRVTLSDVGFGVSQVLPIIVEALRCNPNDTLILEQPEIHLHPRVQAILADFFIARSRDGVRFLIESHSEYFIKRLCRRIAENTVDGVGELVNIIFIEKDTEESIGANCQRININSIGEIENWPTGFFDTNEDLYWTQATLKRRMELRGR